MPANDRLRQERLNRGWSQADVAEKIGSDPKTVGRWERGLTSPGPYLCQQLCQLYEKTPLELGLRTAEQPERTSPPSVSTVPAAEVTASPDKPQQQPVRGLKQWTQRQRRPVVFGVLGVVILLAALGAWAGTHWLTPATASTQMSPDPYTGKGTLAINDPLSTNLEGWSTPNNDEGTCGFTSNAYQIQGLKSEYMKLCLADHTYYRNFVYEVQLLITAGDCGGLAFRGNFPLLYYFVICQDGHYRFTRYDRDNVAMRKTLAAEVSPAIKTGFDQINTIAIVANSSTFRLYINHKLVGEYIDTAYAEGQLGLLVHTCRVTYPDSRPNLCDAPTQVSFQDMRVWKL